MILKIPEFLSSIFITLSFLFYPAISGQRIRATMVIALKVACIVIVAQSEPVRS